MVCNHLPPLVSYFEIINQARTRVDRRFFRIASLRRNMGLIALFFFLTITFMLLAISKSPADHFHNSVN